MLLIAGTCIALVLSAFFSGTETGVYTVNRVRLRVASERGDRGARRIEQRLERPEDLVITSLLGTNVADYLATACVTALLIGVAVPAGLAEVYTTAIVTPLVLVFGGIVPKDWFRREADRLMPALAWPMYVCYRSARATGIVYLLRELSHGLYRWIDPAGADAQHDVLPRARTLRLLREGAAHGGLTDFQRDAMERVLKLSDVRLEQVMVPRARAATVPHDISRDDFLRIARMAHFSRLPVWEGDPKNVVGIVNVYDVLTDEQKRPVAAHMREATRLPAHVSVASALLTMQRRREVMAIAQDRAGAFVGVLTLKDLVEEIVGDLDVW